MYNGFNKILPKCAISRVALYTGTLGVQKRRKFSMAHSEVHRWFQSFEATVSDVMLCCWFTFCMYMYYDAVTCEVSDCPGVQFYSKSWVDSDLVRDFFEDSLQILSNEHRIRIKLKLKMEKSESQEVRLSNLIIW